MNETQAIEVTSRTTNDWFGRFAASASGWLGSKWHSPAPSPAPWSRQLQASTPTFRGESVVFHLSAQSSDRSGISPDTMLPVLFKVRDWWPWLHPTKVAWP